MENKTEITPLSNFDLAQREAKALSASDLVPTQYKGNVANTLVALEIAHRIRRQSANGYAKSTHHSRPPFMV